MKVSQMHMMRIQAAEAKRHPAKKSTPLAKEIEARREFMIRGILDNTPQLVQRQLEVASLPVGPDEKNNDVVLKASQSLLDRVFGKPKESLDLSGNVQFSLRALAQKANSLEIEKKDMEILE